MTTRTVLTAILALSSCSLCAADFHGMRFRCGSLSSNEICMGVLKRSCDLQIQRGTSLPPEIEERAVLVTGDRRAIVRAPSALLGCVHIDTEKGALEYVRFFSSLWTVHWFDGSQLEVFPGRCIYTCLPRRDWRSFGLPRASVTRTKDGFEVRRVVARRGAERWPLRVFELLEKVSPSGAIEEVSARELDLPSEIRSRLKFPSYQ